MGTCFSYEVHFAGQFADAYTSCHYNLNRYYDPDTGRYISVDPLIEMTGGAALKAFAYQPQFNSPYGYVGNNPVMFSDPWGLLTEVIIWQPVGWGRSSFGHVSVNINGKTYTFDSNGMHMLSTDSYLKRNRFREGVGLELGLSTDQENQLERSLKGYSSKYGILSNNCGDPVESGLENLGYNFGNILFPVSLGNRLSELGIVDKFNFYGAIIPRDGTSAPWTK